MNYDYSRIPQITLESLREYVEHRVPTGGFLKAVLTNKLSESFSRADNGNCAAMFDIVHYCYNKIPSACWGSDEKYENWLYGRSRKEEE